MAVGACSLFAAQQHNETQITIINRTITIIWLSLIKNGDWWWSCWNGDDRGSDCWCLEAPSVVVSMRSGEQHKVIDAWWWLMRKIMMFVFYCNEKKLVLVWDLFCESFWSRKMKIVRAFFNVRVNAVWKGSELWSHFSWGFSRYYVMNHLRCNPISSKGVRASMRVRSWSGRYWEGVRRQRRVIGTTYRGGELLSDG